MNNKVVPRGLGVFSEGKIAFLFYSALIKNKTILNIDSSSNGLDFHIFYDNAEIKDLANKPINLAKATNFQLSKANLNFFLTFNYEISKKKYLACATSDDLISWKIKSILSSIKEMSLVVPNYQYNDNYVMFTGGNTIQILFSKNLADWTEKKIPLLKLNKFYEAIIGDVMATNNGIILLYFLKTRVKNTPIYQIKALLLDRNNPRKIIWEPENPIWEQPGDWNDKNVEPLGVININNRYFSYWNADNGLLAVPHLLAKHGGDFQKNIPFVFLERHANNPILEPIVENSWESKAVFNPAAIYEDGTVYIIYRAVGDSDTSVLGMATTKNGIEITERLNKPIYVPRLAFEGRCSSDIVPAKNDKDWMSPFISGGGGYGGCEDPRIVKIEGKLFLTYIAYDGANPPRVALSSINVQDFLNQRWDNWSNPVLISPPGIVDKNACLLPEKINGKYVIFHRVFPNILVDFVDNLNFDGKTKWLKGEYKIRPRDNSWDSRKLGIGAPPIKTKDGWLTIYQAVDDKDSSRYKIGAMILDLNDPTRVLFRSDKPILEPLARYENEGCKYGVVYPCGSVILGNNLYVYYGGADKVVCAATANLNLFLRDLKYSGSAILHPINVKYNNQVS